MQARKIYLKTHCDLLVNADMNIETKAVIVGAVSSGNPETPLTFDDMMKGKPILDGVETASKDGRDYICTTEAEWAFLVKKVKAVKYMLGGRAILAAIQDIIDAEVVNVDERETSP